MPTCICGGGEGNTTHQSTTWLQRWKSELVRGVKFSTGWSPAELPLGSPSKSFYSVTMSLLHEPQRKILEKFIAKVLPCSIIVFSLLIPPSEDIQLAS